MNDRQKKREERKAKKAAWKRRKAGIVLGRSYAKYGERLPLVLVKEEASERPCGECQACCMAVAVKELDKPMWTPCRHQCDSGCGVYDGRPESCRDYYCLWQAGILKGEENRPDRLGIIFDYRSEADIPTLSVWEIREGAADESAAADLLGRLSQHFVIVIRRFRSMAVRVIGPLEHLHDCRIQIQD